MLKIIFKSTATMFLTIEFLCMAAVRHRSFDGWWRYRYEVKQIWSPAPYIKWVETE